MGFDHEDRLCYWCYVGLTPSDECECECERECKCECEYPHDHIHNICLECCGRAIKSVREPSSRWMDALHAQISSAVSNCYMNNRVRCCHCHAKSMIMINLYVCHDHLGKIKDPIVRPVGSDTGGTEDF